MRRRLVSITLMACMLVGTLTACGSSSDSAKNSDAKYKVGVCQLVQHDALDAATEGFSDALKEKLGDDVDIDIQNAAGDSTNCSTIANTFVANGYDLIMGNATDALVAATQATDSIPIVGTSITDYATALQIDDWTGKSGMNVTGTADLAPLDEQAAMIQELFPDAKNVGILYCSAEANSIFQSTTITGYLEKAGLSVKEYTFSDTNDIASVVTNACKDSDVLYIPTDNTAASCTETINSVALAAGVPIVAGEEGICSGCGVATLSISYYDIGYRAGEMAYEILVNGKDPADMEIEYATDLTKEYNAEICEKLQITVPDDYKAIEKSEE